MSQSKRARTNYKSQELERKSKLEKVFSKSGVDHTIIRTDRDFVQPLMQLLIVVDKKMKKYLGLIDAFKIVNYIVIAAFSKLF